MAEETTFNHSVIGETLRRVRKLKHYSMRELAKLSGVSAVHILRLESGEYDFRVNTIFKITPHLGVPAGELLEEGVVVHAAFYDAALLKEDELHRFIPSTLKRKDKGWNEAVSFASGVCVIVSKLLRSSNPIELATRYNFPCASVGLAITRTAQRIQTEFSHFHRAEALYHLRTEPAAELDAFGVISPEMVAEYLDVIRKPKTPWKAHWVPIPDWLDQSILKKLDRSNVNQ